MALTHYVSIDEATRSSRYGLQRTVCGIVINAAGHSVDPTCPTCQELLKKDDEERVATLKALAAEFPDDADRLLAGVKP